MYVCGYLFMYVYTISYKHLYSRTTLIVGITIRLFLFRFTAAETTVVSRLSQNQTGI